MKNAFTMIELIFVIVILGILGAVAIPRLSATRDDAQIVTMAQTIGQAATEIAAYATAKGMIEDDFTQMSNHLSDLERTGQAVMSAKKAVIKVGKVSNCLTMEVNTTDNIDTLNIVYGSNQNDAICQAFQDKFPSHNYPMQLRGNTVAY